MSNKKKEFVPVWLPAVVCAVLLTAARGMGVWLENRRAVAVTWRERG